MDIAIEIFKKNVRVCLIKIKVHTCRCFHCSLPLYAGPQHQNAHRLSRKFFKDQHRPVTSLTFSLPERHMVIDKKKSPYHCITISV